MTREGLAQWVEKYREEAEKKFKQKKGKRKKEKVCKILIESLWGVYSIQVLRRWAGPAFNFYEKGPRGTTVTEHRQEDNRIVCEGTIKRYIKAWGVLVKGLGLRRLLEKAPEKVHMPELVVPERPLPTELDAHKIETGVLTDLSSKDRKEELLEDLAKDPLLEEKGLKITDYDVIDVYLTDLEYGGSEATLNAHLRVNAKKTKGFKMVETEREIINRLGKALRKKDLGGKMYISNVERPPPNWKYEVHVYHEEEYEKPEFSIRMEEFNPEAVATTIQRKLRELHK